MAIWVNPKMTLSINLAKGIVMKSLLLVSAFTVLQSSHCRKIRDDQGY